TLFFTLSLHDALPIWFFQMRQNIFRSVENFFRQTGQARDVDSVAFIRAAGDDLSQKNDLIVPFAHSHIEIADAAAFLSEFRQLVIMTRKESACLNLVVQKFGHAPCDGESVECRCSATDLVQNNEAPFGSIVYD